jgi:hypothetical protein
MAGGKIPTRKFGVWGTRLCEELGENSRAPDGVRDSVDIQKRPPGTAAATKAEAKEGDTKVGATKARKNQEPAGMPALPERLAARI